MHTRQKSLKLCAALICGCLLFAFSGCSENNPVNGKPNNGPESLWKLQIEKADDAVQGHYQHIALTMTHSSDTMGSFDFTIEYNTNALAFLEASLGTSFSQWGWEYFTYRLNIEYQDNKARGLLHLTGVAETNNGAYHPDWSCLGDIAGDTLVMLTFLISNSREFECTFQPLRFYWSYCDDNIITGPGGDSIALSRRVYDADGTQIQDYGRSLPGIYGAPDDSCLNGGNGRLRLFRSVDFVNGGIDIMCVDSADQYGDLNSNGIANEVADAILFSTYFIDGPTAFGDHVESSTQVSDVNRDGITLSLEDFVYLIRIIVGDALPQISSLDRNARIKMQDGRVTMFSPAAVGAVLLTFHLEDNAGEPILNAPNMSMIWGVHGSELRVLVYDIGHGKIPAGSADLVTVPGTTALRSADVAGFEGYRINAYIVQSQ